MGTTNTKSLFMLKTHIDSINIVRVVNDFVSVNMLWAFGVICNYVLYVFGLVLRYFFRFLHLGDAKDKPIVQPLLQDDGIERNQLFDSEVDGFREELADFLFWSEDFHEGSEEAEGERECSVFPIENVPEESEKIEEEMGCSVLNEAHFEVKEQSMKTESSASNEIEFDIHEEFMDKGTEEDGTGFMASDSANSIIHKDSEQNEGEIKGLVSMETDSDVHDDGERVDEAETKSSTFMENGSDLHNNSMKRGEEEVEESKGAVFVEVDSDIHKDVKKIDENETGSSVFMENDCGVNEDGLRIGEDETDSSLFKEEDSIVHADSMKRKEKEEEETDEAVFVESDSVTNTNMCQYLSGKDISGFMEEPTTLRFSFREFYMGPDVSTVSDNAYANTEIIADMEFSEFGSEKESMVQKQVSTLSSRVPLCFESEAFGGTDSSDEDYFLYNENSLTSDSESESSCSSGLVWGNSNKMDDDSIAYQFMGGKIGGEGFEPEILKLIMREEKQSSCDEKVSEFGVHDIYSKDGYVEMEPCMKGSQNEERVCRNGLKKSGETRWEDELSESESDEDDLEWEHDDLVEQLKLELKNSRQGGLATIFEEEEDEEEEKEMEKVKEEKEEEEEETVSPKVVEDLKRLKIEEKLEYKDQIDEIEKVYKSYEEKMRKLDILNYQTMHALGLVQLKDRLKLISIPKSTIQSGFSQNLWPRKASKNTNDPLMKIVRELNRDLELVYVGQVCLSWEILCWQHKKALELQQYDSQGSHRYNHVAGEFQLFQVLVQRFIENEPFQGPRIQNYVKNRCVIRNLLQVPAVKDDDGKGGEEENAIASGRLAEIIKESMRVFWEFVRADKDYGNMILKVSQQNKIDLKDPVISGLLVGIRTQLQKKERKLKDIVRSGNCIVKKFQKHQEDQLDHEQLVAQVGLRLISRVVNMSKLRREQIIWCNEKLHRIKFLSRKIVQVEPSFLLFPC